MISSKMLELGKKSSVIREIFEYGRKRKAEIGEENVFDFSLGNPSIPAPEIVTETLLNLVSSTEPTLLHGYTSAAGDTDTREKIASYITKTHGTPASFNRIYMTCGAAAGLTISLSAIISSDNDEIIVPAPFFPEYKVFIEKAGGNIVPVLSYEGSFQLDIDAIEKAINKNTKGIIINSPNNPTGVVYTEESLKELAKLLSKKQNEFGNTIYLISDEPYRELSYGVEVPFIPNIYDNTVVCYSFSKSLSLPGERIGYIFVPESVTDGDDLFFAVCGAGRALGFVCAPSLLQYTVGKVLGQTANIEVYKENRDILVSSLTDMGYSVTNPDGAFYLFVKAPNGDANEFAQKAKEFEILFVPSDSFGCEGYVRISYCVSKEKILKSLPSFKKLIECYSKE